MPPLEDLPHVDEHVVEVAAPERAAYDAVLTTMRAAFGGGGPRRVAALLGCEPRETTGWDEPGAGATVPGFRVVAAEPPELVVVAGCVPRPGRCSPGRTAPPTGWR